MMRARGALGVVGVAAVACLPVGMSAGGVSTTDGPARPTPVPAPAGGESVPAPRVGDVVRVPCRIQVGGRLRCTIATQGRPVVMVVRPFEDGSARVAVADPDRRGSR